MAELKRRADGARIRAAREAKGWNQDMLATEAGYKRSVIQKLEQGMYFSRTCLECCAEALGVKYDALLTPEPGQSFPTKFQISGPAPDDKPMPSDFVRCVTELRDVSPAGPSPSPPRDRYPHLERLIEMLDESCFMVTTSVGVIPLALRRSERMRWAVKSTQQALAQGASVVYIVPSEGCIRALLNTYRFNNCDDIVESMVERFEVFQNATKAGRQEKGITDRSHMIRSDQFPITPLRELLILIGKSNGGGSVRLYVLNVSPTHLGITLLPESRTAEEDLRAFVDVTISKALSQTDHSESNPMLITTLRRIRVLMSGHLISN